MTGLCQEVNYLGGAVGVMFVIFGQCVPITLYSSLERGRVRGFGDRQTDSHESCLHSVCLDEQFKFSSLPSS